MRERLFTIAYGKSGDTKGDFLHTLLEDVVHAHTHKARTPCTEER